MAKKFIDIPKEVLLKLYVEESKSLKTIAQMYGVQKTTISYKLAQYGIQKKSSGRPKGYTIDVDKLKELLSQRITFLKISKILKVPVSYVAAEAKKILSAEEIEQRRIDLSKKLKFSDDELIKALKSYKQIDLAKKEGVSRSTVCKRYKKIREMKGAI